MKCFPPSRCGVIFADRSIAEAVSEDVSQLIDAQVRAEGPSSKLAHVYEPDAFRGALTPAHRLYDVFVQTSSTRNAQVSWVFRAAHTKILSPVEKKSFGLIDASDEQVARYNKNKSYIFRQQAFLNEYGTQVTIKSRKGPKGILLVPEKGNDKLTRYTGSYVHSFEMDEDTDRTGAFTQKFMLLTETLPDPIIGQARMHTEKLASQAVAGSGRVRKKTYSISFTAAENKAKNRMKRDLTNVYDSFEFNQ